MNHRPMRLLQTFVVAAVALFATMVFLGNILDYSSNEAFVKHVLSMDTTFEGNSLMWRAITNEGLQTAAYIGIIVVEFAIAVLAWIAAVRMIMKRKASSLDFSKAKTTGYYAFGLAILLWFVGFICFGSEWFAMWQSGIWNGKQTAMDIVEVVGIFLIFFSLPEFLPNKDEGVLKEDK